MLEWFKGKEEETDSTLNTDSKIVIKLGFTVFIIGFVGFIIWGSFAPMINGINIPGTVTVASEEDYLQSRFGGTIKKVLIKDGSVVKKGQALILLNGSRQKADYAGAESQYIAELALYGRLKAEQNGRSRIKFPSALLSFKNKNDAQAIQAIQAIDTQDELFNNRKLNYNTEENIYKTDIAGLKSYLKNIIQLKKNTSLQIIYAKEELKPLKKLAEEGYYPKVKVLEIETNIASLQGKLNEEIGDISKTDSTIGEYEFKLSDLKNNFLGGVNTELSSVQKRVFALRQEYLSMLSQVKHSKIKSPVSGIVVKIYRKTSGSILMPGQAAIDILPLNQNLIIKAHVPAMNVARVRKGLTANLVFPEFNAESTPVINGRVIYISANSIIQKGSGTAFYICKIKIGKKGLKTLAEHKLKLKPGMPVEVTVKTGKTTLIGKVFKPIYRQIYTAFVK